MIAGKSAKQIFTASLSCALRSCIIDGFAKMPLRASIFASWYNKHNTKDEKRDRFPVMCLLNRSEASRFAACTYGIISSEQSMLSLIFAKNAKISTRHVCEQIVWQNERREGACSFRVIRVTTFGGSKPPPYGQTRYDRPRQKLCLCGCGIINTRPCCCMYVYYVHERGKAARLASIESSFGKRRAACLRRCRTFY